MASFSPSNALPSPFITLPDSTTWFMERSPLWQGQSMSLQVSKLLYHARSQYQEIIVFESVAYGTVMVLDGVIQITERDEFAYQEMIVHPVLMSHKCPKKVLVVGGGDGGVLREVLKHESLEQVYIVEIDEMVVEVAKKYLPSISQSYQDPRVTLKVMDGELFMKEQDQLNSFDVIITDSSDPIGPADVLFKPPYFQNMYNALNNSGLICSQAECIWLHLDLIQNMKKACMNIFPSVEYAYCSIPTYPSGQIGFMLCAKETGESENRFKEPVRSVDENLQSKLKYYNSDIHRAAFVLPEFARKALSE